MSLRACSRCGGTLTDVFRFCPACGHSSDEPGWPADDDLGWPLDLRQPLEAKAPISFPVVERPRRSRRAPRRTWSTSLARAAGRRPSLALHLRFPRGIGKRMRHLVATSGEAIQLLAEVILVCLGSVRDVLRSTVLLRRLHAQRAAVIYSTGCAALSGDARRVEHARTELRMLDDLITAATGNTPLGDVLTQESVRS